jgi:hypothetical protein
MDIIHYADPCWHTVNNHRACTRNAPHCNARPGIRLVSGLEPPQLRTQYHIVRIMLSSRGSKYTAQDLAASYTKERDPLYNKAEHPDALVSLAQAENVFHNPLILAYLNRALIRCSFLCKTRRLNTLKQSQHEAFTNKARDILNVCSVYHRLSFPP